MIRIFLMDRYPVFRLGLGSFLEKTADFRVVGDAAGVPEALEKMAEVQPDVLLMDVSSSNGSTLEEALVLFQQKYPQVKVIVLTDSDKKEDFFKAIKSGARGYLRMSLEFPELIDSIRLVASGGAIVYSTVAAKLVSPQELSGREGGNGVKSLSAREKEVLGLVARGSSNKEIAVQCCVSPTTVKAHLRRILEKLEVKNRAQAVAMAMEKGYLNRG